jgi:hypothetical protein
VDWSRRIISAEAIWQGLDNLFPAKHLSRISEKRPPVFGQESCSDKRI